MGAALAKGPALLEEQARALAAATAAGGQPVVSDVDVRDPFEQGDEHTIIIDDVRTLMVEVTSLLARLVEVLEQVEGEERRCVDGNDRLCRDKSNALALLGFAAKVYTRVQDAVPR
jgi:hypothetical protein